MIKNTMLKLKAKHLFLLAAGTLISFIQYFLMMVGILVCGFIGMSFLTLVLIRGYC